MELIILVCGSSNFYLTGSTDVSSTATYQWYLNKYCMEFSRQEIYNLGNKEIFKSELINKGFVVIKNLIDKNLSENIRSIMSKGDSSHESLETIFLRNHLNSLEIYNNELYELIKSEPGIHNIEKILRTLPDSVCLARSDAYKSKKSDVPILRWHNDKAFGGDKIIHNRVQNKLFSYKLFIHATSTKTNDGCFSKKSF